MFLFENSTEQKYELYNALPYPLIIVDETNIIWVNHAFLRVHNFKIKELTRVAMKDIESVIFKLPQNGEYIYNNQVSTHSYQVTKSNLINEENKLAIISFFDISKRKALEEKLTAKQKMFEQLSEQLPEGIVMFKDKFIYSNPAFEKLLGYSGKELLNRDFLTLIVSEQRENFKQHLETPLTRKVNTFELLVQVESKKSQKHWVKIKTKVIILDAEEVYLSIVSNISVQKLETDKLHQLAYFDALTGIYNRRKFNEILEREYNRSKRYDHSLCGLFFDIDHFKKVNDSFGHDAGDDVLQLLSKEVSKHIRDSDCFARWGGEEFIILLIESNIEQALSVAEHLRKTIEKLIFPKVGKISISIGLTQLKENERSKSFLKRLDNALYQAKKEGRNRSVRL